MRTYNYDKLNGKIKEVFGTQENFAVAMLLSPVSLSAKLNNKVPFTQAEINKACELLGIALAFIPVYFFTEKVQKHEQTAQENAYEDHNEGNAKEIAALAEQMQTLREDIRIIHTTGLKPGVISSSHIHTSGEEKSHEN